jgi:hypothetical protein
MLRLAPHHRLYRVAVDEWRHVTPALEFHRVSGPDALVADVVERLAAGGVADPDDPSARDDPGAPLVRLLRDRGALAAAADDAPRPLPGTGPVALQGTGPVAAALHTLLGPRAIALDPDEPVPPAPAPSSRSRPSSPTPPGPRSGGSSPAPGRPGTACTRRASCWSWVRCRRRAERVP